MKRPSDPRVGKRSVTTLSVAQLERKRANDREAQRIVRKRKKEQIENLERQVAELGNQKEQLNKALQRNSQLEAQIALLQYQQSPDAQAYTDTVPAYGSYGQQMDPYAVLPQSSTTPKPAPKFSVKALPAARDHMSDQLGPEGDEYIPREFDEAGEKKVDALGHPQGGRQYRCRTFNVPGRGEKLFMLATECARVLTYRDSYLLFNKNRSLYKIIATQKEKEDLIEQEILPFSSRSRQIAIVTARSIFRQFASRVIVGGRRVRDDYWESKARKQGFTEDDPAGEKQPGASGARETAVVETQVGTHNTFSHGDVVHSSGLGFKGTQPPDLHLGLAATMAPLPMTNIADDHRFRDICLTGFQDFWVVP